MKQPSDGRAMGSLIYTVHVLASDSPPTLFSLRRSGKMGESTLPRLHQQVSRFQRFDAISPKFCIAAVGGDMCQGYGCEIIEIFVRETLLTETSLTRRCYNLFLDLFMLRLLSYLQSGLVAFSSMTPSPLCPLFNVVVTTQDVHAGSRSHVVLYCGYERGLYDQYAANCQRG